MSTPLKLAGFAALLALVFGVAVAAGDIAGPDREGAADERARTGGHGPAPADGVAVPDGGQAEGHGGDDAPRDAGDGATDSGGGHGDETDTGGHGGDSTAGGHGAADPIRGLSVRDDGLELALARTQLPRGEATELRFAIRDADGAVRDFEVEHEKRMHVIVVRRDGRGFQHLHPRLDADGEWSTPITLPDAGAYRVFADFKHDGEARTLAADLTVDGPADYRSFPRPADVDRTDGYEVKLNAQGGKLSFDISRDGRPITTEPYLGAGGHLVALREGDLAYLHVHPEGEGVAFEADLEPGVRYHLFLQFKHRGRVHTAELTR